MIIAIYYNKKCTVKEFVSIAFLGRIRDNRQEVQLNINCRNLKMGQSIGQESKKQTFTTMLAKENEIFLGKWSGFLTQFGASTRFILNLVPVGGKIIPILDSPDQDVTGILASDLQVKGDSIFYKLGIACADYKGRLDREKMFIDGIWTQRSVDYPLKVTKVKENE